MLIMAPGILLCFSKQSFLPLLSTFCLTNYKICLLGSNCSLSLCLWSWAVLSECAVQGSIRAESRVTLDLLSSSFSEFSLLFLQSVQFSVSAPVPMSYRISQFFIQPQAKICKIYEVLIFYECLVCLLQFTLQGL